MRTVLLFLSVLLLFPSMLHAQFAKGDRMAGSAVAALGFNAGTADISVASIGSNTSRITGYSISIQPSLGWFLSEKTATGFTFNLSPNSQKTTYEQNGSTYQQDKNSGFNIGLGGFARTYFSGNNLLPFGQFSLNGGLSSLKTSGFFYGGIGSSAYKTSYTGSSSGGLFINSTLTAGLTRMLGENAGLDLYAGYHFSYNKNVFKRTTLRDEGNDGVVDSRLENETTTSFTNHGFTAGLGFQVFLRKRN